MAVYSLYQNPSCLLVDKTEKLDNTAGIFYDTYSAIPSEGLMKFFWALIVAAAFCVLMVFLTSSSRPFPNLSPAALNHPAHR